MIADLASLVTPRRLALFSRHFGEGSRLHLKAADPDRASHLFPWAVVNRLVSGGNLSNDIMYVLRDGSQIPRPCTNEAAESARSGPRPCRRCCIKPRAS